MPVQEVRFEVSNFAASSSADDLTLPALLPLTEHLLTPVIMSADGSGRRARGGDRLGPLSGIVVDSRRLGIIGLVALDKSGMECLTLGAVGEWRVSFASRLFCEGSDLPQVLDIDETQEASHGDDENPECDSGLPAISI